MTIHKFLDDAKRLLIWAGIIFAGLFAFGASQKRKGREELKAEINESALNNSREARKTDDKVSKMSESELDDTARRNGWMLDDEDDDKRV